MQLAKKKTRTGKISEQRKRKRKKERKGGRVAEVKPRAVSLFRTFSGDAKQLKKRRPSVCLKREFSEEDARQLGLGRRIGVRRGYNSPVARETKTREPRLDASSPR